MSTAPTITEKLPPKSGRLAIPTPLELIDRAIAANVSAEAISALYSAHERWLKEQQRLAFIAAMQQFKANQPEIEKTHKVQFTNRDGSVTKYWHAELDKVNKLLAAELQKYGITVSWVPGAAEGRTTMECVLRHCDGHEEHCGMLSAPADDSGGKNRVQQVGSTATYLQRYTLFLALGIAAENKDDDARQAGGMEERAIEEYLIAIGDASSLDELKKVYEEAKRAANAAGPDHDAMKRIVKAKDTRKRALQEAM